MDRLASEPSSLDSAPSQIRYCILLPHRAPRIPPRNRTRRSPRSWEVKLGLTRRDRARMRRGHRRARRRMWLGSRLARTPVLCVSNRGRRKGPEQKRADDHVSPKHFRSSPNIRVASQIEMNYQKCIWPALTSIEQSSCLSQTSRQAHQTYFSLSRDYLTRTRQDRPAPDSHRPKQTHLPTVASRSNTLHPQPRSRSTAIDEPLVTT